MMMGMLAVVMSDNVAGTMMVRFLDLKKELSSFQREAEESDRVVNDFIKVDTRGRFNEHRFDSES